MLLTTFSWLKSERFWRIAISSLFFLGFLGGVFLGALLIFPPPAGSFVSAKVPPEPEHLPLNPQYDAVFKGAFSLHQGAGSALLPILLSELQLLGANTRPGHADAETLKLCLKGQEGERIVRKGEPLYLQVLSDHEGRCMQVAFAKEKTPYQLKALQIVEGKVRFELNAQEDGKERSSQELELVQSAHPILEAIYFQQLKGARWWGADALIRDYGGEEFVGKKECSKLELVRDGEESFCFVSPGDFLVWDGQAWAPLQKESVDEGRPLARVEQVGASGMELAVWNETGFDSERITLPLQSVPKRPLNLEAVPASIRLRSAKEITCLLNKRRYVLKEGDWVLHTAQGWRILKRSADIEGALYHRLRGELFIFDKLEKQQGRLVAEGHYFNEMRTEVQKVSMPVLTEQKKPTRPSKP